MQEHSQIDEMRTAIRGDFERLAERRGVQELMQVRDEPTDPEPADEPGAAVPRRSWLRRLFVP